MKSTIITAILVSLTFPATAETGPWAASIIGTMKCNEIADLIQKSPTAVFIVDDWARGFMAGRNVGRTEEGAAEIDDIRPLTKTGSEPWDVVKPRCEAHPDEDLVTAWMMTYRHLNLPKLARPGVTDGFLSSLKKLLN